MAVLNQFQQYSQGENTATNNVLLMLSNLYEINPKYYEEFIQALTEGSNDYEVIPTFLQQKDNRGNGIIDGFIEMRASKIIIETKLHGLEFVDKLLKYKDSFDPTEFKLLWHLSTDSYSIDMTEDINKRLSEHKELGKVHFNSVTYEDLAGQLSQLAATYPYEPYLQRLNQHFEDYCIGMGLMPKSRHVLRAMACGQSFDLNVKYQFYFDLASRGYRHFNYLGIYKWKSVRYLGKVENVIVADWNETDGLIIKDSENSVSDEQKERLISAIRESLEQGWGVDRNHRFFLLNEFNQTDFKKTTPGGIFRVRYIDIEKVLDPVPDDVGEMAEQLKNKTWE